MLLSKPEFAWHTPSWEEGDGAQRSQTQHQGWELGYTWLRGRRLGSSEPQFCLCWEHDEHRDCCRAALGIQWALATDTELSREPKIHGELLSLWVGEPQQGTHTGIGEERELLTFPSCCSPSHPVPHLVLLQLLQAWLLSLVHNSCWKALLAPSACTAHGFGFLLLLLCCLFFCLPLLPFFPFVLPVGACRLW